LDWKAVIDALEVRLVNILAFYRRNKNISDLWKGIPILHRRQMVHAASRTKPESCILLLDKEDLHGCRYGGKIRFSPPPPPSLAEN
jgi:hypothetical protein